MVALPLLALGQLSRGTAARGARGALTARSPRPAVAPADSSGSRPRSRWPGLDRLGQREAAGRLLAEAAALLRLSPDPGLAVALAADEPSAPRARVPERDETLTAREAAVLRLLPSQLTLREIAEELYVSHNTVKTHSRTLYRKLDVSTRDEAVATPGPAACCRACGRRVRVTTVAPRRLVAHEGGLRRPAGRCRSMSGCWHSPSWYWSCLPASG